MPQVLAAAIVWAFPATATVVVAGITVATIIASAVVLLGTMALSAAQKRKAERAARAQFDASQFDRLANVPATVAPRELVLGRVRKGGTVFFRGSSGAFKQSFAMCITMAAHEIDGYEQFYFNDQPIEVDSNGDVITAPWGRNQRVSASVDLFSNVTTLANTPLLDGRPPVVLRRLLDMAGGTEQVPYTLAGNVVTITGYDPLYSYGFTFEFNVFSSVANVKGYLGAAGQTSDARMQSLFPGVWTAAHRADGIAYIRCAFEYDETAFPSGLPSVTALIRGAKLYDPRDATTSFKVNPALMMRYVLMHPQFGKRTSMTAAEDTRIGAAASACDVGIAFNGANTVPTYRASIVIPFGAHAREALDDLSQAMGGQWAYASGEFFLRAGVYQAPVLALTDADLAVVQRTSEGSSSQSPITISTHKPRNEKVNSVVARIWDEAANYLQTPISPFRSDAYITADGAELVQEVTMPAVFYACQAYHIAGIMLRDSRDPLTVTLPFKLRAYPVELFDSVTVTLSRYGWVAKEFQVLGRTFTPDGLVQLTLKETAASIFQWGAGFFPQGYALNTTLPNPWDIQPPTITSVTSSEADLVVQADGTVVNGLRVAWLAIQDATVKQSGAVEIQYRITTSTEWRSVSSLGDALHVIIVGVPDNAWIAVRGRTKNTVAVSAWGPQFVVQAIGKRALPPDITGLSIAGSVLSWGMSRRPPDLAGFVFRFHYGDNLDWNSAAQLHTGLVTESPYDLVSRPSGIVTIMGKAVDTSGNMSANTANIVMNLGDPAVSNIVEQWNFSSIGWPYAPGEQSGWTLVDGNPSADAIDSFAGTDDQSRYGDAADSFYGTSAYGQMVYVSPDVAVNSALAGSIITLSATSLGTDLRIDYRLSGPDQFYQSAMGGGDNDSFYDQNGALPLYGAPGVWQSWPGRIVAAKEVYQFKVTIGATAQVGGVPNGTLLALEDQTFIVTSDTIVRFGHDTRWVEKLILANIPTVCSVGTFGSDPAFLTLKQCEAVGPAPPPPPPPPSDVTKALLGVSAQGLVGIVSPPSALWPALTGVTGTGAVGAVSSNVTKALTGVSSQGLVGTVATGGTDDAITTAGVIDSTKYGNVASNYWNSISYRFGAAAPTSGGTSYYTRDVTPFPVQEPPDNNPYGRPASYGYSGTYQNGMGVWQNDAGGFSSNTATSAFVADSPNTYIGVANIEASDISNGVLSFRPELSWTRYGQGIDAVEIDTPWRTGGYSTYKPTATARNEGRPGWGCQVLCVFEPDGSGRAFVATTGGNTMQNRMGFYLPAGLTCTAISVTNSGEFALFACWDTARTRGVLVFAALTSLGDGGTFAAPDPYVNNPNETSWGEARFPMPGRPGISNYMYGKVLGQIDLPTNVRAPTEISCTTSVNRDWYMAAGPANVGCWADATYPSTATSNGFRLQNRMDWEPGGYYANASAFGGTAVVVSRTEKTACFVNLGPLFDYYRQMYYRSSLAVFAETENVGDGAGQWPYTFAEVATQIPTITSTLTLSEVPVSVHAAPWGPSEVYIGTASGKVLKYSLAGSLLNTYTLGSNITDIRTMKEKASNELGWDTATTLIVTARGSRKIFFVNSTNGSILKTIYPTTAQCIDPIATEDCDNNTAVHYDITVADYTGRQLVGFCYGPYVPHSTVTPTSETHYGPGPAGTDVAEYGGFMALPGMPWSVAGANNS